MRKLILTLAMSMIAMPSFADDAALLLGVERYQNLSRVVRGSDVTGAETVLSNAGYKVRTLANGSGADMRDLLAGFANEAQDADRLVLAMSGRFVTDGTRTWYLGADVRRPSLFSMPQSAVSVQSAMAVMAETPGQSVLVLGVDTSDDDSIGNYLREGLGFIDPPQGVTVIYADSRYIGGLISNAVAEPGADVMAVVRDNRRLNAIGYQPRSLVMQPVVARPTAPVVRPPNANDDSLTFWTEAQRLNTADSYRDFVFRFPNSVFANEARERLDAIESDPTRIDRLAEEALGLTRNQRRAIQRDLTLLEFNTRGVDGIFGRGSRSAIRNWQQSNGFNQSSFLTREQINRIDAQASRKRAEIEAEEERQRQEQERLDRAYWEETGARGDEAGYRAYLNRYPEGNYAEEAKNKLAQFGGRDIARAEEEALNLNPILARLVERRLEQLGYEPGRVDGRFDDNTRRAIGRYQAQRNLPATGFLNEPTVARLLAEALGR